MSYRLITKDGETAICCTSCGHTSWNKNDVKARYCGTCHKFHEPKGTVIDPGQDRLVDELYAWVCTDLRTGLEGLFGMNGGPTGEFQAVTSSKATALKIGDLIKTLPFSGKRFKLVRFSKPEVLQEL